MKLVWAATPEEVHGFGAWIAARIPHMAGGDFGPSLPALVVNEAGDPVAGVVFHEYQPTAATMQASIAADQRGWCTRAVMRSIFDYPFRQCGVSLLWAAVPHDLPGVLSFNARLGLRKEAVLRHRFGWKRHAVIASMTRGEWRRSPWYSEE